VVHLHLFQQAFADRSGRAASPPWRAEATASGSSISIRRTSVFRAGTGKPRARHSRATSL